MLKQVTNVPLKTPSEKLTALRSKLREPDYNLQAYLIFSEDAHQVTKSFWNLTTN
jgi:hypothetical protein